MNDAAEVRRHNRALVRGLLLGLVPFLSCAGSCSGAMRRAQTLVSVEARLPGPFLVLVEEGGEAKLLNVADQVRASNGRGPVSLPAATRPLIAPDEIERAERALGATWGRSGRLEVTRQREAFLVAFHGKDDSFWSAYAVRRGGLLPLASASCARRDGIGAVVMGIEAGFVALIVTLAGMGVFDAIVARRVRRRRRHA